MAKGERHPRGGLYFEDFVTGRSHRAPLHAHRHADGQHAVLQHDAEPAAAAHRPPFLREGDGMGQPLMNSLFTLGLMIGMSVSDTDRRHHDRQSRHDRREISRIRCSRATPCTATTEVMSASAKSKSRPGAGHRRIPSPRLQPGRQARRRMQAAGFHAETAGCLRAPRFVGRGAGISPACAATFSMTLGSPSRRKSEIEMKRMPAGSAACGAAAV